MPKKFLITVIFAALLGFLAGRYSGGSDDQSLTTNHDHGDHLPTIAAVGRRYVCPMHAEIVSDQQGSCPICAMDLVINRKAQSGDDEDGGLPVVTIEPSVVHNLGIRTATVEKGVLHRSIETIGKITRVDPTARRIITPPVRGELVYIADKHDGDLIEEGELLFRVSSVELIEIEKEFQQAYRSGDRASATSMIPRLREMGLTPEQIARLQAGEEADFPVEVYAFEDGFIFARRGFVGESVHTGFTVFNVGGGYKVIEVTAEIFERQWGWVEEGQTATMTVRGLPGTVFEGKVVRVEPPVGYTTRSLEVALKFRTDHPGISQSMFAHVSILGQPKKNVLTVPADSVIRTGEGERVVLVRGDGRYQPVPVVAGEEAGGIVEILSGLEEGEQVVASGQFLIDSESNLLTGFRRMYTPGVKGEAQQRHQRLGEHGDDKRLYRRINNSYPQPESAADLNS